MIEEQRTMNLLKRLLIVGLATLLPASSSAQLARIGAAGAVAGRVQARSAGQAVGRVLESGKPLFLNDRVTTEAGGRLQVMLLDETVFTIGPNSDLTLDEFVYDPATSAGKVSAKVTKGVFRFVTGKVARREPGSMKIKMPVGTIGIRGTIAAGQVGGTESTVILLGPGAGNNAGENPGSVGVANGGSEVSLDKPGFGTTVSGELPPSPPADMSDIAAKISAELDAAPSGKSQDGSGGGSASDGSGQDTAAGGALSSDSAESAETTNALNNQAAQAAQEAAEGVTNGLTTWDQVRTIESGSGYYSGSGVYTCTAGCSGSGSMSFAIDVNFAARTLGGGSSSISLTASPLSGSASTTVTTLSFASLSGESTATLPVSNSEFSGTTMSLLNKDGVIAKEAKVNVAYDSTITTDIATGSATGSRSF